MTLTPFERIILDALVAGDTAELVVLREQVAAASATARELTGVGFFATLAIPPGSPRLAPAIGGSLSDVGATLIGVEHGVGFVLFLKDGALDVLEGFTYGEAWPAVPELIRWYYLRRAGGSGALLETPVVRAGPTPLG